jgi:uncharacterized membrane protein
MSVTVASADIVENNPAIARNYAFILVGILIFPFMIVAHFTARKRRNQPAGLEQSHYVFQYRTTLLALLSLGAIALITLAMIIGIPSKTQLQQVQLKMWFGLLTNVCWFILLWTAIRCIRGIYLAGARRAILSPKTLWVWSA